MTDTPGQAWLGCRHGHADLYTVKAGGTTECKACRSGKCDQCGPDGARVSIANSAPARARADALRGLPPSASDSRGSGEPGAWLPSAWALEAPPVLSGEALPLAPFSCPGCKGQACWAIGQTVTWCPRCQRRGTVPAVAARAQQITAGRAAAQTAARAAPPDPAAALAARLSREEQTAETARVCEEWARVTDPAGLPAFAARAAASKAADRFRALAREARQAASPDALGAVRALLSQAIAGVKSARLQQQVAAARAELAADDDDDDDGRDDDRRARADRAQATAQRMAKARQDWFAAIGQAAREVPDPVTLEGSYSAMAADALDALDGLADGIAEAVTVSELNRAVEGGRDLLESTRRTARTLRGVIETDQYMRQIRVDASNWRQAAG